MLPKQGEWYRAALTGERFCCQSIAPDGSPRLSREAAGPVVMEPDLEGFRYLMRADTGEPCAMAGGRVGPWVDERVTHILTRNLTRILTALMGADSTPDR